MLAKRLAIGGLKLLAVGIVLAGGTAMAADETPVKLSANEEVNYTINTLIMFICAVLVIFMQAGFALLEVGLNAAKNAVNILFKNLMDFAIGALLFLFIGYGLMYPSETLLGGWLGKPAAFVSRDAQVDPNGGALVGEGEAEKRIATPAASGHSVSSDFLFQVAFAATAATIVSGAVAGRMKFSAYLVYSAVISAFVYPISGMWKWGYGPLHQWGFADFAGSIVVHAVGGFAALAGAIVLGPRLGRFTKDGKSVAMPGHNLAFAALGVFVLWVGWYGFNPGSLLTYTGVVNAELTTYIALTTTIAAAAGTVTSMLFAWILFKKPDLTMALNGSLAGLVGITANCDQVTQQSALIIGAIAGVIVVLGIILLDKLRIDDPVGAFPVHGMCGVWGGIATGIFGSAIPAEATRMGYILIQLEATAIICAWSFSTMLFVFFVLKLFGALRVTPEEEMAGLDISEHGMHAYPPSLIVDAGRGSPTGGGYAPMPGKVAPVSVAQVGVDGV